MDRNSIIGLLLIGALLVGYTVYNQPSEQELKQQQKAEAKRKELAIKKKKQIEATKNVLVSKQGLKDSVNNVNSVNSIAQKTVVKEEIVKLESKKINVDISTKGGIVSSVELKKFKSYHNFSKKKNKGLTLFKAGDNNASLVFELNGQAYTTQDKQFNVLSKTVNKIQLAHEVAGGKIIYTYKISKEYGLDFDVTFENLSGKVRANTVQLLWKNKMRQTERLLSEQRRVSTICFQNADGQLDWNNEVSNEQKEAEQSVNWIAFKQSYFSAILHPKDPIQSKGTKFTVTNFTEGSENFNTHIRDFAARVNLGLSKTDGTKSFTYLFVPNDYNVLKSYKKDYDDILNLGWGIFRWINLYAVQPMFSFFISLGINGGIAILLLTIVLKLFLMPIQWKMFVSSAKMKLLKPQIEEINTKYPNKEDAMKKQMDMMSLYRTSGASPLAGCVPMLVQMPILLAVFRFFPTSFDLRQRGFLWAEDLSSFDSIMDFNTWIPFYGNHISLFTLLMAATTLIYTHLNSGQMQQQQQPGMPNMKVIMYIFPIMMIFFFNNYASGLSYYYFISTLMTILLMFLIKKFFVNEEKLKAKMEASRANSGAKSTTKKKSKFMERLEEMQRQQQEQIKNRKK